MSDLVGNPEDRFSDGMAQITVHGNRRNALYQGKAVISIVSLST